MKDNVFGYESLTWIIEQSEDGLYVATATPRMQREIASHYSSADVCVYDYSTDVKPFTFSVPARLFRDNPDKRAYFLLNVQLSLLDENGQFDDVLLERLNFCRDMFAREKKSVVFFMTEEAARQLNRKAYDFHSYIRLFLDFEDDSPDEAVLIKLPETLPDRSVGVAPPEIDFGKPRNALLAQAIALRNRAKQFFGDGRYRDAETLLRGALDIRERLLDKEHPDVAAALHALGKTYEKMGRYDEARAALQRALDIRTHTLGERHPDTAASCDRLAAVYRDRGEYDRALALFQTALSIREQVFGTE
ncbi:MAG: tetratricopeptide repeat protein, partial [Oscillospiraceae bacterium]|nr:tetratricopeptide repeat protein [Oscillospiraceae bacterium]